MPNSIAEFIPRVMRAAMFCEPKSILDIGSGYGKWGLLFREYLESWRDRVYPAQWEITLTGVEICTGYVEQFGWFQSIYDEMINKSIKQHFDDCGAKYDLIMAGDVIEHMEKHEAMQVLDACCTRANKMFVLSIPLGPDWLDNIEIGGNEFENHKSVWNDRELMLLFARHNMDYTKANVTISKGEVALYIATK